MKDLQVRDAGRLLDAEVAERVMGYSWYSFEDGGVFTYLTKWMNTERETMIARRRDGTLDSYHGREYSTDIASAFLVVEAMQAQVWGITIQNWSHYGEKWWTVVFRSHPLGPPPVEAKADSLPLAICLAALAALEADASQRAVEGPSTPRDTTRRDTDDQ